MKKICFYFTSLLLTISALANPDPELLKTFAQTFPEAINIKWSDNKDGYFVSFIQNSNLEKVFYDKKGSFVCSWKYSNGNELPTIVFSTISKNYKDFKIIGVTEFSTSSNYFYDIKLTTNRYWYSIKISPYGEILEKKRYKK